MKARSKVIDPDSVIVTLQLEMSICTLKDLSNSLSRNTYSVSLTELYTAISSQLYSIQKEIIREDEEEGV